ncbi:MAG: hypothetical protein QXI68_02065 [Sulfolobales archaeon]
MASFTLYLPSKFKTYGHDEVRELTAILLEKAKDTPIFVPWIPPFKIHGVNIALRQIGFRDATPALPEGEEVNLSKPLSPNNQEWELHIRIFRNGELKPHVEANREYFEHLTHPRIYVVYEAYEYYRISCPEFYLKYEGEWVSEIIENYSITMPSPSSLAPWKPVAGGIALAAIIGVAI